MSKFREKITQIFFGIMLKENITDSDDKSPGQEFGHIKGLMELEYCWLQMLANVEASLETFETCQSEALSPTEHNQIYSLKLISD